MHEDPPVCQKLAQDNLALELALESDSKQPAMAALANWNAKKSMLGACRRAAVAAARQQPALKSSSRGLVAAQKKPPLVAVFSPMDSPALKALPGDVNAELLIGSDVPSLLSYGDRLRDAEGDHIGYRIRASISFCSVHQRHVVRLTSILPLAAVCNG